MERRLLAPILASFVYCLWAAAAEGADIQTRFTKSLEDAAAITNVEIQMIDTLWIKDPSWLKGKKEFYRTFQSSYIASGPKYRTECKTISASETNVVKLTESAFNGKTFGYIGDQGFMSRRDENPKGDTAGNPLNPLAAPFMFLSRLSDECPECRLRFSDIQSPDFIRGLTLPPGQSSDGLLQITFPGATNRSQPTLWRISVDKDGDSFTPEMISRVMFCGVEVDYRLLDYTNLGGYQFPSTIAWTSIAYPPTSPPTLLSTGMTTVISVGMPEHVADSMFEIDEKSAAVVWDWSKNKLTKMAPELATVQVKRRAARRVLITIILLTLLAAPIIIAKSLAAKNRLT